MEGIFILQDGIFVFVNRKVSDYLGVPVEGLEGTPFFDYVWQEDRDEVIANYRARIRGEEAPNTYEFRIVNREGTLIWVYLSAVPMPWNGSPAVLYLVTDITERREAENDLRHSEMKFRALAESTSAGIFLIQGTKMQYVNPALVAITGYSADEFAGMNFWDIVHPDYRELVKTRGLKRLQGEEQPPRYEIKIIAKDGREKWLDLSTAVSKFYSKNTTIASAFDITEQKRAEQSLRESEEKYRTLSNNIPDIIYSLDRNGNVLAVSDHAVTRYGHEAETIVGMPFSSIIHPEDRERVVFAFTDAITNRREHTGGLQFRVLLKDGESVWVESNARMRFDEQGNCLGEDGVLRNITEHKRALESLQESRQQLLDIINFFPDATVVVDREGKVIAWNQAAELMTGIRKEDMLGKGDREYSIPFYGDRRPSLIDLALHPDPGEEARYTTIRRKGDTLFGEAYTPNLPPGDLHMSAMASVLRNSRGEIVGAIECLRNNTERRHMEERLARAEKMEALGTLAGGVAHDLNNVLGVLVGYSELLVEKLPEDSSSRRYAENILTSSIKGAAIIQDLLTLARRGVAVSEVVDLNGVVREYLQTPEFEKLLSFHRGVIVRPQLGDGLLNIKGSPIHLAKTVMNLVSNAAEAISGQGVVAIRTENRYLDRPLSGYDDMQEGDYVVLTVSDTGKGIPAKDIDKIFEPFYSKKVMGRSGTGLGLAIVWGTVKDHGGYIDVKSKEGVGTTFTLYFPVTRDEPAKAEGARPVESLAGNGESILVVDDVKEQRELAISMLTKLGYRVEAVSSGEEAISYIDRRKADLVVLDMIMEPGIDGLETYRRIRENHPRQKAIIVSGFSETERVREAQELGAGTFVRKPYIMEKIGIAVRRELDRE
ncbi:MAG: PAS domain S-box protein [Syntrophaceae bacterium]|nr:PAS domain S-box protein [Syntrophaceae bacterium]